MKLDIDVLKFIRPSSFTVCSRVFYKCFLFECFIVFRFTICDGFSVYFCYIEVLKSPGNYGIATSIFGPIAFCFMYFEALLLGKFPLVIFMSDINIAIPDLSNMYVLHLSIL